MTDHNGAKVTCGYDFDMPERQEAEYVLENIKDVPYEDREEEYLKNLNIHMEVRDRYAYLYNLLKRCYKSKRPVVLKGQIISRSGGLPWFSFSWAVQIDDVLDRIPGRNLLITVDDQAIISQNNLDIDDEDDMKEIDVFHERTLTSIRKEVFSSVKKKIINQSENSVFLRNKKTKKISVAEKIESGGGSSIIVARKKLDGSVEYFFLNKSDFKGKKIPNQYYDQRYMIGDSVKGMISGKPYVSSVEFTRDKIDRKLIKKD